MEEVTKERLKRIFLFEKPHIVSFEYRKEKFKGYKKSIRELLSEKLIERISKDNKTVAYKYIGINNEKEI